MRSNSLVFRRAAQVRLGMALLSMVLVSGAARAAYYQAGDVITNFLLYARPSYTNSGGFADDAPMRLSDFVGKIIFVEFFDPT